MITVVLNDRRGFAATAASVLGRPTRISNGSWSTAARPMARSRSSAPTGADRGLRSGPDRGMYDAMNHGLGLARGEFVVFMNAGDGFAEPETLARGGGGARSGAAGRSICVRRHDPRSAAQRAGLPPAACGRGPPALRPAGLSQATFVRRALHQAVPHDLAYQVSSDYYTIARMCRAGARTLVLDVPLALPRLRPAQPLQARDPQRVSGFRRGPAPGAGAKAGRRSRSTRGGYCACTGPISR